MIDRLLNNRINCDVTKHRQLMRKHLFLWPAASGYQLHAYKNHKQVAKNQRAIWHDQSQSKLSQLYNTTVFHPHRANEKCLDRYLKMTHLVVLVVMVILVVSVQGDPECSGCMVKGTCHESGYTEKSKIHGWFQTCTCEGTDWRCVAVGEPVFQETRTAVMQLSPHICIGCMVDNLCKPFGFKKVKPIAAGTETCTCDGIESWACTAVGNPVAENPAPTMTLPPEMAP
ncbi:uncharacterized protein LOC121386722 [Gigantopelta aegis]|uniref:uncharacterized protein LOC121386722 n=1 Tax=Gigantopelta aegis TaxID=1735272 RepID=UPI001B88D441|nr:uncharacterized protein LOC121386722 [Gigantopelta aegis]XP_041373651.1 uncharacterized protein LOC121386722 [Gigantopelta aegis]